jgi:fatty-acyl-CoA synthase
VDTGLLLRGAVQPLGDGAADRPALSLEDVATWSYRELDAYANRAANALLGLGVRPGDRVGLMLLNSLEYVGLYFGITRIGAIAVRLNWRLAGEELVYAIEDSGCSVLCVHDTLVADVEPLRERLSVATYVGIAYDDTPLPAWLLGPETVRDAPDAPPPVTTPTGDERAMIMYTSGTTGRPKGAVWTHAGTVAFATMQQTAFGLDRDTVAMSTGPLFHVGSFEDIVTATLLARGHAILTRSRDFEIDRLLGLLERLGVSDALLQPTMIYDVLRSPRLDPSMLRRLRRLYTGGTNIHEWALEQLARDLPALDIVALYGLTEGGAISTWATLDQRDSVGNVVGVPLPLTEVRVVRDDPAAGDAGDDEEGEVWVRSASSSREYWGKPEATAETFVDGWCRTGDAGRIEAGRLVITGRKKDMIKSGGENIYPVEVENVLMRHPSVAEVSVIGVPDVKYQETVCAVVVAQAGAEVVAEELVAFCRLHLASYKKPRHVVVVADLPRTITGKVRKHVLREAYAALGAPVPEDAV